MTYSLTSGIITDIEVLPELKRVLVLAAVDRSPSGQELTLSNAAKLLLGKQ